MRIAVHHDHARPAEAPVDVRIPLDERHPVEMGLPRERVSTLEHRVGYAAVILQIDSRHRDPRGARRGPTSDVGIALDADRTAGRQLARDRRVAAHIGVSVAVRVPAHIEAPPQRQVGVREQRVLEHGVLPTGRRAEKLPDHLHL